MTTRAGITELLAGGSESFRRSNAHLLAPRSSPSPAEKVPQNAKDGAGKRLRQNGAGLNKTEQAFFDRLRDAWVGSDVLPQRITLWLGNGVRYTPDFVVASDATNEHTDRVTCVRAFEVKGYMRDDAAVKLKVAAALYPWIKFHLVTKKKGGGWDVHEVHS